MSGNLINWNEPVEWSTGEATSVHRELGGGSTRWVGACDDWRDLTGDAGVAVDMNTGRILGCEDENLPFIRNVAQSAKPERPGVYLHLFHGRDAPDQDMDGWGFNGPTIGPLAYVHTTYACDVKFSADVETMRKFFPDALNIDHPSSAKYGVDHHLDIVDGLLVCHGKFYGDWSVCTEPATGLYRIDVLEGDEVVHTEQFDGTALDAEKKLGDVWNSGPWVVAEAGRYRAVLTDISGDGEYVWQEIAPEADEEVEA